MGAAVLVLIFCAVFLSCSNVYGQLQHGNNIIENPQICVTGAEIRQLLKDFLKKVKKELNETKNELKEDIKAMCKTTSEANEVETSSKEISSNNHCAGAMFFKGGNIIDHAVQPRRHDNESGELPVWLDSLTSCFWIKTTCSSGEPTVLSYAVPTRDNEWLIYLKPTITLWIRNTYVSLVEDGYNLRVSVNDGKWHHVCVTWDSRDGTVQVFKDSVLSNRQTGFMKGQLIEPLGQWVIGQDQDTFGGGFAVTDAFRGVLTEVQVWSKVLNQTEISTLANNCGSSLKGNYVAYSDFVARGDVRMFKPPCCG